MGWYKPAVGPLHVAERQGYARAYAILHLGLRAKPLALPTAVLIRFARLELTTEDVELRRSLAGLTMTALTFSRPGDRVNLLHDDVALYEDAIPFEKPDCKHGGRTDRERILMDVQRRPRSKPDESSTWSTATSKRYSCARAMVTSRSTTRLVISARYPPTWPTSGCARGCNIW